MSNNEREEWLIVDEGGNDALYFTSFISLDIENSGESPAYPLEGGAFVNYNKISSPQEISAEISIQGDGEIFDTAIRRLDYLQINPIKLYIVSPFASYGALSLSSYRTQHRRREGGRVLNIDLHFTEVISAATETVFTKIPAPKNKASSNKTKTGKQKPESEEKIQNNNSEKSDKKKSILAELSS